MDRNQWDEIDLLRIYVAPLAGSVDRNISGLGRLNEQGVAPLAGSVDRNLSKPTNSIPTRVAPLAGSVDRNIAGVQDDQMKISRSPRGERG